LRAADAELLLLIGRQVALVVHWPGPGRAAIAGHVDREDVIAGRRQIPHPAVILIGHVEADFGRRAGAVHEQHHLVAGAVAQHFRQGALADIELGFLARDGGHRGYHRHGVIARRNVVRKSRRSQQHDHGREAYSPHGKLLRSFKRPTYHRPDACAKRI